MDWIFFVAFSNYLNFDGSNYLEFLEIWITKERMIVKAESLQEGIIFLIHLFARAILLMKKLKIKETKAT